jgi:hypothetical protein
MRQLKRLVRDGDVRDLGAEEGERLPGEEEPEVAMAPERADVDGGQADGSPQPAGLLGDRNGRRGREPLGLVGSVEGAFAVDPRRLCQHYAGGRAR